MVFHDNTSPFLHQVASPSPDRTVPDAHVGPIDYTKQETIKQEVIKQETVELTVTDRASGTALFFYINTLWLF